MPKFGHVKLMFPVSGCLFSSFLEMFSTSRINFQSGEVYSMLSKRSKILCLGIKFLLYLEKNIYIGYGFCLLYLLLLVAGVEYSMLATKLNCNIETGRWRNNFDRPKNIIFTFQSLFFLIVQEDELCL